MGDGGSAPSPFIAREGKPTPPTITGNDGFPCMEQGLIKSGSCRGNMGKQRRPRPINFYVSTKAAGYWGPRRSAPALWLCLEAKPERALGPGATVGVLGTGVPRLACLRPAAWLKGGPSTAHLHQHRPKTLARGQASRGGRHGASSGTASSGWLARRRRDQGGVPHEVPVTQAITTKGARREPARAVSSLPLWCKGGKRSRGVPRHQAKVSISVQRDQDQQDGRTEVTVEPKTASSPVPLVAEDHL